MIGRWLPRVRVPWAQLGVWPTPLVHAHADVWVKREGASSPRYGGNKVRTLEAWLGHAQAIGARRIWAIGAYGSNHAIATVVHARALGLDAGVILFPQPHSPWAAENAGAVIASACEVVRLRSVIEVPFAGFLKARRELDASVEAALKAARVWDEVSARLDDSALVLSLGQQQRLVIARALAVGPEILLMDEPASALDPAATLRFEELLHELAQRYTVLLVTHNMQQAARVSDYTAFLHQGRLVEFGDTDALLTNPRERLTEDYITGRYA